MTPEQILTEIERIYDQPTMSNWARGFCDSIGEQIRLNRRLSEKQTTVMQKIFAENSERSLQDLKAWGDEYARTWQKEAKVLATYYKQTGYYSHLADTILRDEIPFQIAFLKMCSNKYAKKVLAESRKLPKYDLGTHVTSNSKASRAHIRSTVNASLSYGCYDNFRKRGGIIIEVSPMVHSAAKGAKRYKILPIGAVEMFWIEERFMKKHRPKPKP
jgi:hypothetical protein|tara:strand:+ start:124 stop:771 length:648 start_codon:yes stop_codon:yes gene_type:complete